MYSEILDQLCAPECQLFERLPDGGANSRVLTSSRSDLRTLEQLRTLGRLVAKALFDKCTVADRLSSSTLKFLLTGKADRFSIDDLAEVHSRAKYWGTTMLSTEGIADLMEEDFEGLEPNGAQKRLTERNKHEWLKRKQAVLLYESRRAGLEALHVGFTEACRALSIPTIPALLPTVADLRQELCGTAVFGAAKLLPVLRFDSTAPNGTFAQAFCAIVRAWQPDECALFVRFATGSPALSQLIHIRGGLRADLLPVAHTCFCEVEVCHSRGWFGRDRTGRDRTWREMGPVRSGGPHLDPTLKCMYT